MSTIQRKPVGGLPSLPVSDDKPTLASQQPTNIPLKTQDDLVPPPAYEYEAEPKGTLDEGEALPDLDEQLANLELETNHLDGGLDPSDSLTQSDTLSSTDQDHAHSSKWKHRFGAAYNEAKHFAGGLIAHPYEATRHYSVMRHSHGLVYYSGPSTSVAITIFSDRPLPPDRKLWLQKRGFSGRTGLKVGAHLGTRSAWIDVTPAVEATADLLPPADERAWQRDINKFLKKARDAKHICKQRPFETCVVRIPHAAEDGYFRIVVCSNRKVLCPSPAFRYASTSDNPSKVRGASLGTLPLELGVKIGAWAARSHTHTYATDLISPITQPLSSVIKPFELGGLTQAAATGVYDNVVAEQNNQKPRADVLAQGGLTGEMTDQNPDEVVFTYPDTIGNEDGPDDPYPVKLNGRVVGEIGTPGDSIAPPTVRIDSVPEDVLLRLTGVYMTWAMLRIPEKSNVPNVARDWIPAVLYVLPVRDERARVVDKKAVSIKLLRDLERTDLSGLKINLMIMSFLRPFEPSAAPQEQTALESIDVSVTDASLNRPGWQADTTLARIKSASSQRSFKQRAIDAKNAGQKQFDKVPLHRLGVRMNSMERKDQLIGNGGIFVRR